MATWTFVRRGVDMRRILAGLACLGVLAACSPAADMPLGEAGITDFHQKLNAQDFDGIYGVTSSEFKGASSRAEFVPLLAAIHRKLGAFQSGSLVGWNDSMMTSGHMLTINYAAKYERGSANEGFVFHIEGGKAVLAGYHVTSNALIVN
jgi:hypothetical protein